jgi:hypothetical protein
VTVERESLGDWLGALAPRKRVARASKGIAACRDWLVGLRKSGPPEKTKEQFRIQAVETFSIGPDQFRRAWEQAASAHPDDGWSHPGRPKAATKNRAAIKSSGK